MASCVLLLLLLSLVSWLFAAAFSLLFFFPSTSSAKRKKLRVHIPRERIFVFFFRCSRDFFLCVINSSIVGGFDLEVVV